MRESVTPTAIGIYIIADMERIVNRKEERK